MFITELGARGISSSNSHTKKNSGYIFKDIMYSLHSKKIGKSPENWLINCPILMSARPKNVLGVHGDHWMDDSCVELRRLFHCPVFNSKTSILLSYCYLAVRFCVLYILLLSLHAHMDLPLQLVSTQVMWLLSQCRKAVLTI